MAGYLRRLLRSPNFGDKDEQDTLAGLVNLIRQWVSFALGSDEPATVDPMKE